jgi:hypothetical protein
MNSCERATHEISELRERTDGIDFVHENDAGLVVLGVPKHLADHAGALACKTPRGYGTVGSRK